MASVDVVKDLVRFAWRMFVVGVFVVLVQFGVAGNFYETAIKGRDLDPARLGEPVHGVLVNAATLMSDPLLPYLVLIVGAFWIFHGEREAGRKRDETIRNLSTDASNTRSRNDSLEQDNQHLRHELERVRGTMLTDTSQRLNRIEATLTASTPTDQRELPTDPRPVRTAVTPAAASLTLTGVAPTAIANPPSPASPERQSKSPALDSEPGGSTPLPSDPPESPRPARPRRRLDRGYAASRFEFTFGLSVGPWRYVFDWRPVR